MEDIIHLLSTPSAIWFIIGFVFLVSEFFIPGFIILFFGVGGWVTSLAVLMFPDISLNMQLTIFLTSSILSLLSLRKLLKGWVQKSDSLNGNELEEYIGKTCIAESDFVVGIGGKVSFKGALWEATSSEDIKKGDALIITDKESIKFKVKKHNY